MHTDIATRAFVVGLKSTGKTTNEVADLTGLQPRTINRIYGRAIERGFDPNQRPLAIRDDYLVDASRSGRPKKQTPETQDKILAKPGGYRYLCYDYLADLTEVRLKKDETDEEAWVDTEDEERKARMVSCVSRLDA